MADRPGLLAAAVELQPYLPDQPNPLPQGTYCS